MNFGHVRRNVTFLKSWGQYRIIRGHNSNLHIETTGHVVKNASNNQFRSPAQINFLGGQKYHTDIRQNVKKSTHII